MRGKINPRTRGVISMFLLMMVGSSFAGRIITVDDDGPADFNNIQAAIDDSNDGDVVEVQPGLYNGDGNRDIDFRGRGITVRSTDPNDPNIVAATIIDCNGTEAESHRGFNFVSDEVQDSVLSGLTITNGYAPEETIGDHTYSRGGAIYCNGSGPTIIHCVIRANEAGRVGGGVYCYDSNCVVLNCVITQNCSYDSGGGIYSWLGKITIRNCVVAGNSADHPTSTGGGIIICSGGPSTINNCTIVGNSASMAGAGGVFCGDTTFINCIVWGNTFCQIKGDATVSYSDVQDGYPGTDNLDVDPLFVDTAIGDYHLKSQAGRWEPNSQSWVQDEATSPCIDAGNPADPVGYEPFPNGGIINMGAYGGTGEASKSYFGRPVCETIIAGDINGDCEVNFKDFALMALHWLECANSGCD